MRSVLSATVGCSTLVASARAIERASIDQRVTLADGIDKLKRSRIGQPRLVGRRLQVGEGAVGARTIFEHLGAIGFRAGCKVWIGELGLARNRGRKRRRRRCQALQRRDVGDVAVLVIALLDQNAAECRKRKQRHDGNYAQQQAETEISHHDSSSEAKPGRSPGQVTR